MSPFVRSGTPGGRGDFVPDGAAREMDCVIIPTVVAAPRGMIVVLKPVNWEVDGLKSEGGGALLLSSFVQSVLPRSDSALVHMAELDYGFIHRLDVPSSGLVLGGTTLEGLFQLKWQLAVYSIARQYLTANHGHAARGCFDVSERIDATTAETMRSVTDDAGKPARTRLSLIAHHLFGQGVKCCDIRAPRDDSSQSRSMDTAAELCVFVITIHTGRRHQIRAHTRHVGHPCATDARYTPRDVTASRAGVEFVAPRVVTHTNPPWQVA